MKERETRKDLTREEDYKIIVRLFFYILEGERLTLDEIHRLSFVIQEKTGLRITTLFLKELWDELLEEKEQKERKQQQ